MPLAILDATPTRVQVGDLFDTNKRYVYRDYSGGLNATLVKYAVSPTIIGAQNKMTYSFDGAVYWINEQLAISPSYVVLGMT